MKMEEHQAAGGPPVAGESATAPAPAPPSPPAASAEPPASAPPHPLAAISTPRIATAIVLIVGAILFLVNLGGYPLYTKGEPREAVTVYDIVHGGGVILPQRAGVELPSKPLLMHWCAALVSLAAGGVSEFTVRLPSALFAIAGMLVCYFYVRTLFDEPVALLAALILGSNFQYLQAGTGARVDMTLTLFLEIAFFEFIMMAEGLTRRRLLLYLAIALAVLAKGPIGLVLPALAAGAWMVWIRKWTTLRRMSLVRGALVVAIVAGGWYAAALWVGGIDFFRKQILAENLVRFLGGASFHEGHVHRFVYLELALMAGFMPWTMLLLVTGSEALYRPLRMTPRMTYLFTWFLAVLVFYSLAHSKRGVYLLALYPALATILAIYLAAAMSHPAVSRRVVSVLSALAESLLVGLGVVGLVGLAALVAQPSAMRDTLKLFGITAPQFVPNLVRHARAHAIVAAAVPLACEALGLYLARRPVSLVRVTGVTLAGMICVTLAANVIVVPAIADTLTLKNFAQEVMADIGNAPVGYLDALDYDFAFYSRRDIPIVGLRNRHLPDYLIAFRAIVQGMPLEKRAGFTILLTSNPTALDGSGQMVLMRRGGPANAIPQSRPPHGLIEARLDAAAGSTSLR
jgi:4-amino-4-deoxy-L-arabinose transferase-like glycosyltransferase